MSDFSVYRYELAAQPWIHTRDTLRARMTPIVSTANTDFASRAIADLGGARYRRASSFTALDARGRLVYADDVSPWAVHRAGLILADGRDESFFPYTVRQVPDHY